VDRNRIVVMGESAGGGHAAALALAARDRGEVPLAGQVLIYAMLDDRTGSVRRTPPHLGTFVWTPELNVLGWSALLGMPAGSAAVPRGAVPARAASLAGLPPTFIGVGALDLFVEEDIEYARRLLNAGVPTELFVAPGAYHGFQFIVPTAAVSREFIRATDTALARMLRPRPA
jgi:acetyl esterase/lipase